MVGIESLLFTLSQSLLFMCFTLGMSENSGFRWSGSWWFQKKVLEKNPSSNGAP